MEGDDDDEVVLSPEEMAERVRKATTDAALAEMEFSPNVSALKYLMKRECARVTVGGCVCGLVLAGSLPSYVSP